VKAVDEWWDQAACRGKPLAWWFPVNGKYGNARGVCAKCPVAAECAEYADAYKATHGMFGGLDPDERATPDPRCGSEAGFQAHRVAGTRPCDPCRAARSTGQRRRARGRKTDSPGNGNVIELMEALR
jgi:WhiB family redox-sensing transcriptional regulator